MGNKVEAVVVAVRGCSSLRVVAVVECSCPLLDVIGTVQIEEVVLVVIVESGCS
eukprot:gene4115-50_t